MYNPNKETVCQKIYMGLWVYLHHQITKAFEFLNYKIPIVNVYAREAANPVYNSFRRT